MSKIRALLDLNVATVQKIGTAVKKNPGLGLTVSYIVLVFAFRGVEFLRLLRHGPSGELGDFLAGVFAPVALGWLIYGYFLQREELRLQRQELKRTGDALSEQAAIEKERRKGERLKATPRFSLEREEKSIPPFSFLIRNGGGDAYRVQVQCFNGLDQDKIIEIDQIQRNTQIPFSLTTKFLRRSHFFCSIRAFSEDGEKATQKWSVEVGVISGKPWAEIMEVDP